MSLKEQIVPGVAGGVIAAIVVSIAVYLWEEIDRAVINDIPSGAVVAYIGSDLPPHKNWEICDSKFDGRYLVGTASFEEVNDIVGSSKHHHKVNIRTTRESDRGYVGGPDYADNGKGSNWYHHHEVVGKTVIAEHIPPSIKVRFLCKK